MKNIHCESCDFKGEEIKALEETIRVLRQENTILMEVLRIQNALPEGNRPKQGKVVQLHYR